MLRHVFSETTPRTSRQGTRRPRGAGTGVPCALSLLLLVVTVAGFGCAGARVDVTQQAPSEVLQPDPEAVHAGLAQVLSEGDGQ